MKNIDAVLAQLGATKNVKGYYYIKDFIDIVKDKDPVNIRTMDVYYDIVSRHEDASVPRVERAIRHIVTKMIAHPTSLFVTMFGNREKLPNSLFLFDLLDYLKEDDNE